MLVFQSQRSRRLIVRIDRGEPLHATLLRVARDQSVTTAYVSGRGILSSAVLDAYDGAARERGPGTRLGGPLELASLSGIIASEGGELRADLHVVVGKRDEHGFVTVAAHLLEAEAWAAEIALECLDDLGLRRDHDAAVGISVFRGDAARSEVASRRELDEAPRAATPEKPPIPSAWAAVALASAEPAATRREEAPAFDPIADTGRAGGEEHVPSKGDYVDHRQFGLCRVDRVSDDGELLIKLEIGRRKAIRLDVFDVLPPRVEGTRKIYPLRPKKR